MSDQAASTSAGAAQGKGTLGLLNRKAPDDYRREWTERIAGRKTAAAAQTSSAVIFRIGPEWLALPARVFQEIAEQCPVHVVPHRRSEVLAGLVNIRGELLLCASLGALLGIAGAATAIKEKSRPLIARILVTNREGNRVAIPVDEVHSVTRYDEAELKPVPATLTHGGLPFTVGLLPWQGKMVGCLDEERLFQKLDQSFR